MWAIQNFNWNAVHTVNTLSEFLYQDIMQAAQCTGFNIDLHLIQVPTPFLTKPCCHEDPTHQALWETLGYWFFLSFHLKTKTKNWVRPHINNYQGLSHHPGGICTYMYPLTSVPPLIHVHVSSPFKSWNMKSKITSFPIK